jgi:CheY-like chemotaxis protein
MPLISGFEVLDFLRAHPDIKVPVVLMFSGSIIPEDAKKAVDLGATAYVSKPTDFDVYLTLARDIDRQWLAA